MMFSLGQIRSPYKCSLKPIPTGRTYYGPAGVVVA